MAATEEDLLTQLLAQQEESKRAAQLERQKQLEALQSKRGTVDTTAAAAFIDSMYGTNTLAGAESSAREAAKEQDLLQTLLKEERDAGSAAKGAPSLTALLNAKTKERREERQDANADRRFVNTAFDKVRSEFTKEYDTLGKTTGSLNRFDEALNTRNIETINNKLSILAKDLNREAGALSEGDVNRQFLQTFDMKVKGFLAKFDKDQKLSPEDLRPIANDIAKAREILAEVARNRAQGLKGSYMGNPDFAKALEQNMSKDGIVNSVDNLIEDLSKSKVKLFDKEKKADAPKKPNPFR